MLGQVLGNQPRIGVARRRDSFICKHRVSRSQIRSGRATSPEGWVLARKSETALSNDIRLAAGVHSWDLRTVLICFKGNFPRYLCNIASEADLFLKIGVLWRNKDVVDKRLGGGGSALLKQVLLESPPLGRLKVMLRRLTEQNCVGVDSIDVLICCCQKDFGWQSRGALLSLRGRSPGAITPVQAYKQAGSLRVTTHTTTLLNASSNPKVHT